VKHHREKGKNQNNKCNILAFHRDKQSMLESQSQLSFLQFATISTLIQVQLMEAQLQTTFIGQYRLAFPLL
jgi:hypothetical protein